MNFIRTVIECYMSALSYCFPDNDAMTLSIGGFVLLCVVAQAIVGFIYMNVLNEAEKWIYNGMVTSVSDKITKR